MSEHCKSLINFFILVIIFFIFAFGLETIPAAEEITLPGF